MKRASLLGPGLSYEAYEGTPYLGGLKMQYRRINTPSLTIQDLP